MIRSISMIISLGNHFLPRVVSESLFQSLSQKSALALDLLFGWRNLIKLKHYSVTTE